MVQMYVWLVVAILLAVGVLLLAAAATRGDGSGNGDGGGPRTLAEAVSQVWGDFRAGAATLRARLGRGRASTAGSPVRGRSGAPGPRPGAPTRVPVLAGRSGPAERDTAQRATTDAWSFETPQETTIDDFFAATQTSAPAYLDTTQVSQVLHRRR
ncbi:hypothetical protein [Sanguibacter sp. 25GB23B1]|uniref:hypothetical protein n=1 Tax=unclassified Sanguibacter TaxID=2645534 RepID=UPI0032AF49BB